MLSSRISAAVPGIEPRPASRSIPMYSGYSMRTRSRAVQNLHRREGMNVDIGKFVLIATSTSRYLKSGISGLMPPCMQTSVAPRAIASATLLSTISSGWSYASDSQLWRLKPQNWHPTKQMLVKLMLRLTT